ncbi:hypothetical protein Vretimale_3019 [Volvox reticuliferus]|uniref:Uncharacterized protein n=2 Tax=Volvox reticuliferus TaxID=1737510 RepID=A0A8J4DDE3_9CHLO|nr:hypothetical protein Vretimale_3019 [Volvox reticuliferus]
MASIALKPSSAIIARRKVPSKAICRPGSSRCIVCTKALLGPDGKPGAVGAKKKFITREEEPEQYWSSKGEQDGANPLKDPLAIIGILAIFFPFIFLAIAIGTGYVDLSVYR